ncbi:MAG: hypothetical protein ABI609_01335 [Acidobacteriota bacterium]
MTTTNLGPRLTNPFLHDASKGHPNSWRRLGISGLMLGASVLFALTASGSPPDEPTRHASEGPQTAVRISTLAAGETEVTR